MKRGVIRVATCQFAVSSSIKRNGTQIRRQIARAKRQRADVVHFSECALSGYAGNEIRTWDGFNWDALNAETEAICALAAEKRVWVVLGSAHRLSGRHLPHNCLYVISPKGKIVDRYDKRFCTSGDMKYYTPGHHCPVFVVNGVRCGTLICYDVRFPELYRHYTKLGVQCVFHSFWNARAKKRNIHTTIMRPSLQCHAATNYLWISANNSSAYYQSWPSVFIRPDGTIIASLKQHQPGVMVNRVDMTRQFYDASKPFREMAMKGALSNGEPVRDPRSRDRRSM
jgi:predicted amidohydrolase